jgi:hypothetical protein
MDSGYNSLDESDELDAELDTELDIFDYAKYIPLGYIFYKLLLDKK